MAKPIRKDTNYSQKCIYQYSILFGMKKVRITESELKNMIAQCLCEATGLDYKTVASYAEKKRDRDRDGNARSFGYKDNHDAYNSNNMMVSVASFIRKFFPKFYNNLIQNSYSSDEQKSRSLREFSDHLVGAFNAFDDVYDELKWIDLNPVNPEQMAQFGKAYIEWKNNYAKLPDYDDADGTLSKSEF